MGDAADNLSNQRGGLDEALSQKFNVTNGLERKYLEGDKETTKNFKDSKGDVDPNFLEPWLADKLYSYALELLEFHQLRMVKQLKFALILVMTYETYY